MPRNPTQWIVFRSRASRRAAGENIRGVVDRPSFFRRLPTQTIECDPELYTLLVRHPEIIVNIWDLMGITKVEVKRTAPYVFKGHDGAGTTCRAELLYGTSDIHIYYGNGSYSGSLAARDIDGRCVCVLHSTAATNRAGHPTVTVTMDVFMKLDNFGADLLTRTLGPLVGKTADYNFVESAKFVSQLYELCRDNPVAAQQLGSRLTKIDPPCAPSSCPWLRRLPPTILTLSMQGQLPRPLRRSRLLRRPRWPLK